MTDIKSLEISELEALFAELGEPSFRAKQVFSWLARGVESFDDMTNLPSALRSRLAEKCFINKLKLLSKQCSADDGTEKFLWELIDGNTIETVLMRYRHGASVCISSQVGCRMGCAFCASTIGGLIRGLTASEMLDEVLYTQRESGVKISNIVIMGIGEPLDNFENVIKFLKLVNCPDGANIGMRHIALSTCGLADELDRLAELRLQLTPAVSLHAANDALRSTLMPVNRRYGLERLTESCERYFAATGRRVTFEYALIDGVNDSDRQALELAALAKRVGAHVNLIPLNHVSERPFKPSPDFRIKKFCRVLDSRGVNYTLRRRLGGDVDAACGQLRRRQEAERADGGKDESIRYN